MATVSRRLQQLAWLALLAAAAARAEGTSAVAGSVTDARTGRAVAGATVVVEGPAIEGRRTARTEEGGGFTVAELPAGTYVLSVEMPGYEPYRRAELAVNDDTTLRANVALAPVRDDVDEVVVTGTRIRRKDLVTPAPVVVIDRKEIEASGVVGLGEFLQRLPAQGNSLNAQVNRGNDGQVRVSLRSLGSKRTLVLVNGRRVVSGSVGESVVDLNTIPLAAVERIEVLKDGGSPIYGSEAIAGVVNVILRDRWEGTEVTAQGGASSRGDAASADVSAAAGFAGARGSAFFSVGWQQQQQLMGDARRWSATALAYDYATGTASPYGSYYTGTGVVSLADPGAACAGDPSLMSPALAAACSHIAGGGGNEFVWDPQTGSYRPWRPEDASYNFQREFYLLTPARRLQLFSAGNLQLAPAVHAFYEASFVNRRSSTLNNSMRVDLAVSGQSVSNDFGTDLFLARRLTEFGPRKFDFEQNTFRVVGGVGGDLGGWAGPLDGWRWEASYLFGRNDSPGTLRGMQRVPALDAAVGPSFVDGSGRPTCGTPGAPVAGCVPIDLLHGDGTPLSDEQRDTIGFVGKDKGYNELHVLSVGANGRLFSLWADRPVSLAAGFDARRESGGYFPDPVTAAGESTGTNQGATSGGYSSREVYGELSVPLVSERPLLHSVELVAAARAARYSTFGTHSTYKLGGRWAPVRDVTFRGTWSTAFRAPDVMELYLGASETAEDATDPCAAGAGASPLCPTVTTGGGGESVPTLQGGNVALEPETARVLTAGVVLEPRWVKDLSFTVDYWDVQLENTVDMIGTKVILDRCYTADPADSNAAYCSRVHRDPATNAIDYVDDRLGNIGATRTSGVDFAARWTVPAHAFGTFRLAFDGTYLVRFDKTYPDGDLLHAAGDYGIGVLPRWRWDAGLGWERGRFGVATGARYIGSFRECEDGLCDEDVAAPSRRVSANLLFDLAASYTRRSGAGTTTFQVGVRNLLDSAPPMIFSAADDNTDPTYDFAGRFWWGRLTHSF